MTKLSPDLKAVLLDIDGTLLDSNDAHTRAWLAALVLHSLHAPYDKLRACIGKGGDKLLDELFGIDASSPRGQSIDKDRRAIFTDHYLPALRPTAGARELLVQLSDAGLALLVATSAGEEDLKGLLQQAGIEDLIEKSATASDAGRSKPDPDIVEAALRVAGLRPQEVLMLGDTPHDIQAAASCGVRTIALRCGGFWGDQDLKGASALYDSPADLLANLAQSPFARE